MDASRFDGLVRTLDASSSRRAVVALLLAAVASAGSRSGPAAAGMGRRRARRKRPFRGGADPVRAPCANRCHPCSPLNVRSSADLRGCDFGDEILTKRNLSGCDLRGACLDGADLREAVLDGSDLGGACLQGALLVETSLRGVTLKDAAICGANLTRADLSGARVTPAQLECALICSTTMPDGSLGDDDRGASRACPACDDACGKDETCCANICVNTETSVGNCARCGNACPPPTAHVAVTCGEAPDLHGRLVHDCLYMCETGWEDCDDNFDTGCEVFTRGDNDNCGGCGATCGDGMVCCNCACVPVGSGLCGVCPSITSARLIRRR